MQLTQLVNEAESTDLNTRESAGTVKDAGAKVIIKLRDIIQLTLDDRSRNARTTLECVCVGGGSLLVVLSQKSSRSLQKKPQPRVAESKLGEAGWHRHPKHLTSWEERIKESFVSSQF